MNGTLAAEQVKEDAESKGRHRWHSEGTCLSVIIENFLMWNLAQHLCGIDVVPPTVAWIKGQIKQRIFIL